MSGVLAGKTFGQRLQHFRECQGMSRPVLGGLVGRSSEWVKAVETGRLKPPRLPMLIRLCEVLDVPDLAELTGEQKLSRATFSKNTHQNLSTITQALATYTVVNADTEPESAEALAARVRQAWQLWHGSNRQRTAVAPILPGLLQDARVSTRVLEGTDRRRALVSLAQIYHLAQLYLSFQPVPELILMTGDRAMIAAQDADDPHAMASSAWYVNHVYRDAGEQHEARTQLAHEVSRLLKPEEGGEDLARWGLLQLAVALSHARIGREGEAWRAWDEADRAARALGDRYTHPWLIFGRGMVDAYAITINADLMKCGEAVRIANTIDLSAMPSATRRAFHMAETARGYYMKGEPVATVHLLKEAEKISPDTFQFSLFARSAVPDLLHSGGTTVRPHAEELAGKLGLIA